MWNQLSRTLSRIERAKHEFRALLRQPIEPVLHLTQARLLFIGGLCILGHAAFWYFWAIVHPREFESGVVRFALILAAVPFLFITEQDVQHKPFWRIYAPIYLTLSVPIFLTASAMAGGNAANVLAALCVSTLVLYQLTDWRLATVSVTVTTAMAIILAPFMPVNGPEGLKSPQLAQFFFVWVTAFLLGTSTAAQRMLRLKATLQAMGVMAHELRTPLATAMMLNSAIRSAPPESIQRLSERVDTAIKNIHHQIDTQIVNAQLLQLKPGTEIISALAVTQNAVDTFPFRGERDRMAVAVIQEDDFAFVGSARLFTQVIQNLLKNALFSLQRSGKEYQAADIIFVVSKRKRTGVITIKDRGVGVPPPKRQSIFDAFYSSRNNFSSGLGLAFCQQVMNAENGKIYLPDEQPDVGATFVIELPLAPEPGVDAD